MNKGKLCISVAAGTVDELIAKIERAVPLADIIEIRFDDLGPSATSQVSDLNFEIPLIATFRSDSREARLGFWNQAQSGYWACDLEEDIVDSVQNCPRRIASFHDHNGVPADLMSIYERLAASGAQVIKIAVTADDITAALSVWKRLERARADGRELVPIAMGEAGSWTRILGPAHGAFLTYASLDEVTQTADGQFSAREMLDVYRLDQIDRDTLVYGVIGHPISHSLSPYMQNAAFKAKGINAVFVPLLVKDLDAFLTRMVKPASREVDLNFAGFSVTMPHKQTVMQHLDRTDQVAEAVGAVNTVKIEDDGTLTGYNTDAHGFITPLKDRLGELNGSHVAVVGAGGAARAVVYALEQQNVDVTVFARDLKRAGEFAAAIEPISDLKFQISNYEILINATPIGMKGALEDEILLTANELSGVRLVYDLVTRPEGTPLMHAAAAAGVSCIGGMEMLIAQGARQFEIWTGREAPFDVMRDAVLKRIGG